MASKKYSNERAWEKYGSELCTSQMIAEENNILNKMKNVYESLILLEKYMAGLIDISKKREEVLRINLEAAIKHTVACKSVEEKIEQELAKIQKVKDLLK